jgi:RND family efflux transporter MFP subunit
LSRKSNRLYVLLVVLLSLSLLLIGCGKEKETVKESEIGVNVAKAEVSTITRNVKYSGTVRAQNETYIMPKAAARVTAIYVKPGDQVSAGQTLLTLDSSDYEAMVQQAQAGVAMAEASKRANDAQAETARLSYERLKQMYDSGAISEQQLDEARTRYEAMVAGTADAAVGQAQAALAQAQTQLGHCTLTSPINGIVGSVNLSLGDSSNPQAPAVVVTDPSRLEIEIMVSEADISYVKPGSEVGISIKAAGDKTFKGVVDSVSSVPHSVKRNYAVKITLDNKDNLIKSGMFAEVDLATTSKDGVICIPARALVPRGNETVVFTVDKDQRAREIKITTGITNEQKVEVVKGLQAGQQVITRGNTLVNEGTLVRVITGGDK